MQARVGKSVKQSWIIVTVAVLAVPLLAIPAIPQAVADPAGDAFVHTVSPAPGTLISAGGTQVDAWLWSPDPVDEATVRVDGAPVGEVRVGPAEPEQGARVRARVDLAPGSHLVEVAFVDAAGRRAQRAWRITATDRSSRRFAGDDRVDTAVAVSQAVFPGSGQVTAAVLVRADDFADALSGVPLAAALAGPLLLSGSEGLSPATATELRRVLEPGSDVHLLGGTTALGGTVRREVEELGFRAVRHHGADRFETAAAVAGVMPASSGVVIASGASFPDALAGSVPAARDGLPVLLTAPDRLPEVTAAVLRDRTPETVTVVGGTTAVSADVEQQVRAITPGVRRVSGPDRYGTAVAVLDAFYGELAAVSLASGESFPDALTGARHAAAGNQPLLLTRSRTLPPASRDALGHHHPERIDLYGGTRAVSEAVAQAALRAAEDGPDGPRVVRTDPPGRATVTSLRNVTVELDHAIDPAVSSVYVTIGGVELRGTTEQPAADTLTFRALTGQPPPQLDVLHPVQAVVHIRDTDGRTVHHEVAFAYFKPDPVFATAGDVALHLPSREVELVGFHEANHRGAQQQQPRATSTPKTTLPSRQRGTSSRTAADVVADPAREVLAPVSGRVVRAGSYLLYCRYTDHYVVIDPDDRPGWEVKVLHFHGLQVGSGDQVVAEETVIGAGPRQLPFRSQVDDYTHPRDWPHLHVEVVDPSVPTPPGTPC